MFGSLLSYFLPNFIGGAPRPFDCCDVALVSKINRTAIQGINSPIDSSEIVGMNSFIDSDEIIGLESPECGCKDE